MRQRLFWIIAIVLLGLTVHLTYVLFVPNMEMNRIMSAAAETHGANRFLVLDEQEAAEVLGQQSLAFVQGICVIDLKQGPVLVTLGEGSGGFLGFATRDSLDVLGLPDHVAVYFPQSYNFAGNVLLFPRERVRPLEASSAQVMAFIVSGGVSGLGGGTR